MLYSNNIFFLQLSPKKTFEGYIGGGILTVIIGTAFTALCVGYGYPSMTCPVKVNTKYFDPTTTDDEQPNSTNSWFLSAPQCTLPDIFLSQSYQVH